VLRVAAARHDLSQSDSPKLTGPHLAIVSTRTDRRDVIRQRVDKRSELAPELAIAMADYIEHFYNCDRRHSSLGYLTPNEFESSHSTPIQQATLS
jgi:transposase InsO family protein